ncbi:MAG: redoxin domain-containing protein [Acidimicrobiia bacterium]|nr:redoxin domain-containing protein [Acidimicrobiia bacterium]
MDDTARPVRTGLRRSSGLLVRLAALTIVAGSLALAVILGSRFGQDPTLIASPLIGKPAPDLTLPYLADTGDFTLRELRGKVAVINFWASWCVPCRAEHADLVATADAFANTGVRFVGVLYQDDPEPAIDFLDELGWGDNYDYVIDPGSRAAIAFGVFGVPETFFVNPEGVIIGKIVGQSSAVLLGATLDQILRGERPGEHTAGTVQSGPGG